MVVESLVKQLRLDALALEYLRLQGLIFSLRNARSRCNFLAFFAVAYIPLDGHPVSVPTLFIGDGDNAELNPKFGAVLSTVQQLDLDWLPASEGTFQPSKRLTIDSVRLQDTWRLSENLGFGIARRFLKRAIAIDDARPGQFDRLGFRDEDGVVGVHDNRFKKPQSFSIAGTLDAHLMAERLEVKHGAELGGMGPQDILLRFTRCLVPGSRGAKLSREAEEALWQAFFTAAPEQRREFEPNSKRRKRRRASSPSVTG